MARLATNERQSLSASYQPSHTQYTPSSPSYTPYTPSYITIQRRLSKPAAAFKLGFVGVLAGSVAGMFVWGAIAVAGWLLSASFSGVLAGAYGGLTIGICMGSILGTTGEKAGLNKLVFSLILFGLVLAAVGAVIGLGHAIVGGWYGWPASGALVLGIAGIVFGAIYGE